MLVIFVVLSMERAYSNLYSDGVELSTSLLHLEYELSY